MRVCIPIPFRPEGGGQYFLQLFRRHLRTHGHEVVDDVAGRYDVLLTNHWVVPLRTILAAIRHNRDVRIVQRIDGSATDYGRSGHADQRQHEVDLVADLTVFQSSYARWSTREKFPVIVHDGPVIHNPVDLDRFTPDGPRAECTGSTRIASVSWSTNRKKGASGIYEIARLNPSVEFFLCGRFLDLPSLSNVHYLGVLDRDRLPIVLRTCHALLTLSENEACPNHVLEALASGLPILYADSGAMTEVIGNCGLPVTVETSTAQIAAVMKDRENRSRRSRQRAVDHFEPRTIFTRYLAAIKQARIAPPRVAVQTRFLWALGGPAAVWWLGRDRWDAERPSRPASRTEGPSWDRDRRGTRPARHEER